MSTAAVSAKGEGIMTDYQFKSIIKMVLAIAREANDAEKIIKELEQLLSDEKE